MALSVEVVYTVKDNTPTGESQMSIFIPVGLTTMLSYLQVARAFAGFADEVLHGRFLGIAELCFGVDISALLNNTLDAESDSEEIGEFIFETVDGNPVVVNVPGIKEDTVLPNSHQLDLANVNVAGFVTGMTTGVAFQPTDIGERDIVTLRTATERFRNSGSSK